jgi:hypothetical protein
MLKLIKCTRNKILTEVVSITDSKIVLRLIIDLSSQLTTMFLRVFKNISLLSFELFPDSLFLSHQRTSKVMSENKDIFLINITTFS